MRDNRILFATRYFLLDDSNGAAVASRALLSCLSRNGFAVEALCGTLVDAGQARDPAEALKDHNLAFESHGAEALEISMVGVLTRDPSRLTSSLGGVPLTIDNREPTHSYRDPDDGEIRSFLRLFGDIAARFKPTVLLTYGGDRLTRILLSDARRRGMAAVFALHNFACRDPLAFANVDVVFVPSQFAADHYRRTLGLECRVLSNLVDSGRVLAPDRVPKYLTFVNPSLEKGVYPFVRIADELGRRGPDIPILVVESRGSEITLVNCGIDLRRHGNVFLMERPPDPRDFWEQTRVSLLPSLWWENQPLVAIEAMINGVPVIGSDRGGIPEALGESGIVLPLPERLTPSTHLPPTGEEVVEWGDSIIRLWDDDSFYSWHESRALAESRRWSNDYLDPLHADFFGALRPGV